VDAKDFLKQAPLFAGLSPQHLKALGKACTEREFQSGDIIVRQGNPGVGLFIIQSGRVRVEKVTDDGDKIELAEHGPGEVIGELSVIDGATRTASVVALENTQCLVLASWDFNSFLESHPQVALEILPVVVQRFRETNEALIHMQAGKKA
jgi:CRP-like cAMP-binding protein